MFLNKLINIAKSPGSVHQLTNFFQKCSVSTTTASLAKIEKFTNPNVLWGGPKDSNPVDRINDKLETNSIGRMFAVVHLCGKQFKVTAGDLIIVEGYWPPTNGDQIRLDKVLIAGSQDFSLIGRPILQKGLVDVQATVIEKSLSHIRTHFKKKRRKQYMRINFMRMQTTMLRINSVELTNVVDKTHAKVDEDAIYG